MADRNTSTCAILSALLDALTMNGIELGKARIEHTGIQYGMLADQVDLYPDMSQG